ncbi:unnamed protein product [Kluyveromyces dobzhanskii CBS 2104]|uniref:F-actin-capping protein subunit alpha n=1 Tax=Kluyveromyces dobzhanskii CBS 2104 TaxID=1427455 RepID=A0A0A8LCV1_9SACH|nr:unnamed protein product [Kluyveromyces dobzhanskii CBS 2104]
MSDFEKIVRDIVFDSPVEEISLVYDNLQVLSDGESKQQIVSIIQDFNEKYRVPVTSGKDRYIVSEYNKSGSKYYDPLNKVIFSVDHITREVSDLKDYTDADSTDEQLKLADQLSTYVSKFFPDTAAYNVFKIPDSDKLTVVIVSNKKSLGDFWTGYWLSEYIYDVKEGTITGDISVDAHYFEDGNVRFKSSAALKPTNTDSPVVDIKQFEKQFENNLIEKFQYMNATQFKGLRRRLPVTRAKINWGQGIGNYRLGRDAAQDA